MKKQMSLCCTLGMFWCSQAVLAAKPAVAVYNIKNEAGLRRSFLDQMRGVIEAELAGGDKYAVVPSAQIKAALAAKKAESYDACYDESCQMEIGKEVAASKIFSTTIKKPGSGCIVTMKLFDLRTETAENATNQRSKCNNDALVDAVYYAVWKITGKAGLRLKTAGFAKSLPQVHMPQVEALLVQQVKLDLAGVDIDFLERWQAYLRANKKAAKLDRSEASVAQKIRAWNVFLSRSLTGSPSHSISQAKSDLRSQAKARKKAWQTVAKAERTREQKWRQATARYNKDKTKLNRYLRLDNEVVSKEQKAAYRREFDTAYAPFLVERDRRTKGTLSVRMRDKRGKDRRLPFWVDGKRYLSPKRLRLLPGPHTIATQLMPPKKLNFQAGARFEHHKLVKRTEVSKASLGRIYGGIWSGEDACSSNQAVVGFEQLGFTYRATVFGGSTISKPMAKLINELRTAPLNTQQLWLKNDRPSSLRLIEAKLSSTIKHFSLRSLEDVATLNRFDKQRRRYGMTGGEAAWLTVSTLSLLSTLGGLVVWGSAALTDDGDTASLGQSVAGIGLPIFVISLAMSNWYPFDKSIPKNIAENKRRRKIRESLRVTITPLPDPKP